MCCCSKSCLETTCKIFQAFVLIALILFIASFFVKMGKNVIWMAIFIFFILFILYLNFVPLCANIYAEKQIIAD